MPKTAQKVSHGFTLVELLIVMGILAILSAAGLAGFTAAQKRSRDANRKSDLNQFRSSLESYANKNNGLYPANKTNYSTTTLCSTDLVLGFTCPVDPKTASAYNYSSDASGATYVVYASLEAPSPSTNTYFGLCSNGTTLAQSAVPVLATNCP